MGVQGLWTVLAPCARPIRLETLAQKRLAVDASIWIYQFLKAVRDKEGNALRNSHIVGFFRRICKLLYFGIKPVFVFDGGAPVLKRQTIAGRKNRREGRKEDALRTAGRLLAMQMKRKAEEEQERRKRARAEKARDEAEGWETIRHDEPEEEPMPANPVYVAELNMTPQERAKNRTFRKQDPYHLPELDMAIENMGAPNDPRIMSTAELQAYAAQFRDGEESNINLYDFSKIDYGSPFFQSLPITDQYAILSAARLRSRLRMGLSKEQLEKMFPNRLEFSRFQIERVRERNELTQRLMNLNGMNAGGDTYEAIYGSGRVAGEKGREYVLVKNDGVEGGWVLGVVGRKEGKVAPTTYSGKKREDVVVPGDNRNKPIELDSTQKTTSTIDDDDDDDDEFEDVPIVGLNRLPLKSTSQETGRSLAERQRYQIQKDLHNERRNTKRRKRSEQPRIPKEGDSLFIEEEYESMGEASDESDADPYLQNHQVHRDNIEDVEAEDEELRRAIELSRDSVAEEEAEEELQRAIAESKKEHEARQLSSGPAKRKALFELSDDDDDDATFEDVLSKPQCSTGVSNGGSNMLPFESMSMGGIRTSTGQASQPLSVPKSNHTLPVEIEWNNTLEPEDSGDEGGGFMTATKEKQVAEAVKEKEDKTSKPLPPWFAQPTTITDSFVSSEAEEPDLHASSPPPLKPEVVVVDSDEDSDVEMLDGPPQARDTATPKAEQKKPRTPEPSGAVNLGDLADTIRAVPPATDISHGEGEHRHGNNPEEDPKVIGKPVHTGKVDQELDNKLQGAGANVLADNSLTKSSEGNAITMTPQDKHTIEPPDAPNTIPSLQEFAGLNDEEIAAAYEAAPVDSDDSSHYSDPEDEELLLQLHEEAEEHARFASALNKDNINLSRPSDGLQSAEDYERELKALRMQQKKDRRDADEVTHNMIAECQQLLKLFGLPYITAPMEAEAQCAELVRLGLVDGIVTDDSDCFLFGGTRVYKNMFNQAKYVECYLSADLEKEFSLDRNRLISLAHLLGSDYTEGLPGVGPVTALELLTEFATPPSSPEKNKEHNEKELPCEPVRRFRDWWNSVQQITGTRYNEKDETPFKKKFRKAHATKLTLPAGFPTEAVDHAYLTPEVDADASRFEWGVPDLYGLRQFLMSTIGWSQERCDEVLVPVIKDMNRREAEGTQANITRFFEGTVGAGAFAPRKRVKKSKRMDQAMQKLHQMSTGKRGDGDLNGVAEGGEAQGPISMKDAVGSGGRGGGKGTSTRGKKVAVGSKKVATGKGKRKATEPSSSSASTSGSSNEDEPEQSAQEEEGKAEETPVKGTKKRKSTTTAAPKKSATRGGRGRGRGRGSGQKATV